MSEATFQGWAILELMGHRKLAGYVSEATVAGVAMIRINVPQDEKMVTQFYSAQSIYALTPTTEATVRAFTGNHVEPISNWEMRTLPAHATNTGHSAIDLYVDTTDDDFDDGAGDPDDDHEAGFAP